MRAPGRQSHAGFGDEIEEEWLYRAKHAGCPCMWTAAGLICHRLCSFLCNVPGLLWATKITKADDVLKSFPTFGFFPAATRSVCTAEGICKTPGAVTQRLEASRQTVAEVPDHWPSPSHHKSPEREVWSALGKLQSL